VQFPVALERSNFRHSYIPFAAIKKRKKNLGDRLTYLPTRIVDESIRLHIHVQLSTHALLKFTFLRWEFHVHDFVSRASLSFLSLSLASLTPIDSLVASSFLSYVVSCTWLPALRPARPLMRTAGNCAVKSGAYTCTHMRFYIRD